MNKLFFWQILALFIAIFSFTSCASNDKKDLDYIDFSYEVYIDPSQNYTIEDWDKIPFEKTDDLKLGFYTGAIWIKFLVKNSGDEQSTLVIKNEDVFNRNYRFYEYTTSTSVLKRLGKGNDLIYEDDRSFNFPNPNFKITLEAHQEKVFYQYITSDGRVVQVTPTLLSLTHFVEEMNGITIGDFLFYGIVLIVFLINVILWRTFKKKIYFFYTFYILSSAIFYAGLEGYLFGLGVPNYLIDHLVFITLYGLMFFFLFFSTHFLRVNVISNKFFTFLKYFSGLFVWLLLYQFLFYQTSISYLHVTLNGVAGSFLLLVLLMVGIAIKAKRFETKFYLVALLSYLFFVVIGLIDSHLDMLAGSYKNYFKIGFIIEVILFTCTVVMVSAKGDYRRVELEAELKDSNKAKEETLNRLYNLKDKNEALQALINQIKEEKIEKTDFLAIFKLLESNLSEEEDWFTFKDKFEQLNPEFLSILYKKHPDLSKSEIRLLTLVKIGFTQKEIAKVLFIAEDSVKKAKQRVRKKMNIPADCTLPEYLMDL